MKCRSCNGEVSSEDKYCPYCGQALSTLSVPQDSFKNIKEYPLLWHKLICNVFIHLFALIKLIFGLILVLGYRHQLISLLLSQRSASLGTTFYKMYNLNILDTILGIFFIISAFISLFIRYRLTLQKKKSYSQMNGFFLMNAYLFLFYFLLQWFVASSNNDRPNLLVIFIIATTLIYLFNINYYQKRSELFTN